MRNVLILTAAVLAAGSLASCDVDDSLPSRPRTANPFTADQRAQDNAEHRTLETPSRSVPTGGSGDAPRELNQGPATPGSRTVATLDDAGPAMSDRFSASANNMANKTAADSKQAVAVGQKAWEMMWKSPHPIDNFPDDTYTGPLPHLPANPGTVPMAGSTVVPGTDWMVENSWGQGLQLTDYPHRAWPEIKTIYQTANVKHNPVYYFSVQRYLPVQQNQNGSYRSDLKTDMYEVPWFYLNTAALPVLMILEPPLAQKTAYEAGTDPLYHGYLPMGPVVPTDAPGELKWSYPFLNPDGSVIKQGETAQPTQP